MAVNEHGAVLENITLDFTTQLYFSKDGRYIFTGNDVPLTWTVARISTMNLNSFQASFFRKPQYSTYAFSVQKLFEYNHSLVVLAQEFEEHFVACNVIDMETGNATRKEAAWWGVYLSATIIFRDALFVVDTYQNFLTCYSFKFDYLVSEKVRGPRMSWEPKFFALDETLYLGDNGQVYTITPTQYRQSMAFRSWRPGEISSLGGMTAMMRNPALPHTVVIAGHGMIASLRDVDEVRVPLNVEIRGMMSSPVQSGGQYVGFGVGNVAVLYRDTGVLAWNVTEDEVNGLDVAPIITIERAIFASVAGSVYIHEVSGNGTLVAKVQLGRFGCMMTPLLLPVGDSVFAACGAPHIFRVELHSGALNISHAMDARTRHICVNPADSSIFAVDDTGTLYGLKAAQFEQNYSWPNFKIPDVLSGRSMTSFVYADMFLYMGCSDGNIVVASAVTGNVHSVRFSGSQTVSGLFVSRSSRVVAVTNDGVLFDVTNNQRVAVDRSPHPADLRLPYVGGDGDGPVLAFANANGFYLVNADDLSVMRTANVTSCDTPFVSTTIAAVWCATSLRVYDLATGALLKRADISILNGGNMTFAVMNHESYAVAEYAPYMGLIRIQTVKI